MKIRPWLPWAIVLSCAATANGCATRPGDPPATPVAATRGVADGETFAIAPGDVVALADGSRLRHAGIVADSRCPPGVTCVWAGDAEVAFQWQAANGARQAFALHTGRGDRERLLGPRRLVLLALGRGAAPQAQLRIEAGR